MSKSYQDAISALKEEQRNIYGPSFDEVYGNDGTLKNSTLSQSFNNAFTGNLDYQRQLELQNLAQTFSAQESAKQRQFEQEMSNTAYQRAVSDMRKAGLNPYLLYGSGHTLAASTPAGASASGVASNAPVSGRGWHNLLGAIQLLAISAINAHTAKLNADSRKLSSVTTQHFNKQGELTSSFTRQYKR